MAGCGTGCRASRELGGWVVGQGVPQRRRIRCGRRDTVFHIVARRAPAADHDDRSDMARMPPTRPPHIAPKRRNRRSAGDPPAVSSRAPVGIRTPNLLIRSLGALVQPGARPSDQACSAPFRQSPGAPRCSHVAVSVAVNGVHRDQGNLQSSAPCCLRKTTSIWRAQHPFGNCGAQAGATPAAATRRVQAAEIFLLVDRPLAVSLPVMSSRYAHQVRARSGEAADTAACHGEPSREGLK